MNAVRVVDARMGRGKSTAAIRYINRNKRSARFLYVTPYLKEVARVRDECGLEEPVEDEGMTKLSQLRSFIREGKSVSTTHSLYELMDDEMLDMVRDKRYTLIIDEAVSAIDKAPITAPDRKILETLTTVADDGLITWNDQEYTGKFTGYKDMADRHTLYRIESTLINTFNTGLITSFEEVFQLTYLFEGSALEAYLNCFGIPYEIWGITDEDGGSDFRKGVDVPPPIDLRPMIHIVDKKSLNDVGNPYHALAKSWYERHSYHDPEMIQLRKNMQNFFKNITKSRADNRIWTCFKDHAQKLVPDNGSYSQNFLQMMARATNDYSSCTNLAYMVNRFEDPNLMKFLADRGCTIDQDRTALSDLIQWVWRGAIRNGKDINLYIPSRRMRSLLKDWLDKTAEGGAP